MHLDLTSDLLPDDLRLLTIELPDDAPFAELATCPTEDDACLAAGQAFLNDGAALGMMVRSVVVPQEQNILLNPRRHDMVRVSLRANDAFEIDPRFFA